MLTGTHRGHDSVITGGWGVNALYGSRYYCTPAPLGKVTWSNSVSIFGRFSKIRGESFIM